MRLAIALLASLTITVPAEAAKIDGVDCVKLKRAVDWYGEDFVSNFARANGWTERDINAVRRKCSRSRR